MRVGFSYWPLTTSSTENRILEFERLLVPTGSPGPTYSRAVARRIRSASATMIFGSWPVAVHGNVVIAVDRIQMIETNKVRRLIAVVLQYRLHVARAGSGPRSRPTQRYFFVWMCVV